SPACPAPGPRASRGGRRAPRRGALRAPRRDRVDRQPARSLGGRARAHVRRALAVSELVDLTLREASDLVADGKVSAVELLEATLRRVDEPEPFVHAYASVGADAARAAARRAGDELRLG